VWINARRVELLDNRCLVAQLVGLERRTSRADTDAAAVCYFAMAEHYGVRLTLLDFDIGFISGNFLGGIVPRLREIEASLRLRLGIMAIWTTEELRGPLATVPLETPAQATRFNRRLVNAYIRADAQESPLRPGQLQVAIVGDGRNGY
jgi:hypothetical protein